ncbi:MAG: type II toxin-antitoxin system VapB family antitoxin [Microlunatus sp.]
MSLNIKDEQTHELVRELARRTGLSQTAAVREAVRHRLEEIGSSQGGAAGVESRRARALELVRDFQADLTEEERLRIRDSAKWLYDDLGLPR